MKKTEAVLARSAESANKSEDLAARLRRRIIDLAGRARKVVLTVNEAEQHIDDYNRMINQESKAV